MMNVSVEQCRPRRVVAIPHRGDYSGIGAAFALLRAYAASKGLPMELSSFIGIYHDDPATTPAAELRSAACLEVPESFEPGEGDSVELFTIPGGEHAVAVHRGPYSGLGEAYRWLYREWLPGSGRTAVDRPDFEIYLNDCATTPEEELETAIYVPLAS
jgi:AraC family transcriptional regulator